MVIDHMNKSPSAKKKRAAFFSVMNLGRKAYEKGESISSELFWQHTRIDSSVREDKFTPYTGTVDDTLREQLKDLSGLVDKIKDTSLEFNEKYRTMLKRLYHLLPTVVPSNAVEIRALAKLHYDEIVKDKCIIDQHALIAKNLKKLQKPGTTYSTVFWDITWIITSAHELANTLLFIRRYCFRDIPSELNSFMKGNTYKLTESIHDYLEEKVKARAKEEHWRKGEFAIERDLRMF